MNELVQLVQQKTGLSQDMAQKVVETVLGFVKTKVPAPLASGIDELLGGSTGAAGGDAAAAAAAAGGTDEGGGLLGKAESIVSGLFNKKDA
jgi:hypothetical protein